MRLLASLGLLVPRDGRIEIRHAVRKSSPAPGARSDEAATSAVSQILRINAALTGAPRLGSASTSTSMRTSRSAEAEDTHRGKARCTSCTARTATGRMEYVRVPLSRSTR